MRKPADSHADLTLLEADASNSGFSCRFPGAIDNGGAILGFRGEPLNAIASRTKSLG
ncbi:MAG: hypothetical protein SVX43_09020 [Cyanobacteriota bacterium]|nr:hypothetical protein [Cyanobacteriota bacterium]